jgi:hypothetical protein
VSRMLSTCGAALVALVLLAPGAQAQRRGRRAVDAGGAPPPAVGARIGYDFDASHVFLGGQFEFPVARRLRLVPSLELYPGVTGTPYRANIDLKVHPATRYGFFYFGGGLAILHAAGGSNTGVNGFAGWEGRRLRPFRPFLEGKLVFANTTSFNLLGGINFPL